MLLTTPSLDCKENVLQSKKDKGVLRLEEVGRQKKNVHFANEERSGVRTHSICSICLSVGKILECKEEKEIKFLYFSCWPRFPVLKTRNMLR